jgi:peptidoglycan L-alanyl-D-glutamate endopeptidase CwlK
MDLITIDRIKLAHPILRATLLEQYKKANSLLGKNVRLRFSYVLRTFQEQNHLYALGRTEINPDGKSKSKPLGNIVTNSKGGQSIHNYGLAFDIVLLIDKNNDGIFETATWDTLKDFDGDKVSDWMEVVNYFKSQGWEWGGDWKSFKDTPHFQFDFGFSWKDLKERVDAGKTIIDNGIVYPVLKSI